ncbi:chemotaxis protein [Nitratireductor luteus]|uniref:chemotaxis protein n=1 Tax=Nitratireductor luteus TaxID=2976980 RepID=UPI00223F403F|nr:chemotaxis protein [Nitratireductor luteus]
MVRSLQVVQDKIADGDHAALPMQRKLLGIIDEKFRAAEAADFQDSRNFNALLIYGTSGGNPATLASVVSRLELEGDRDRLGRGVVSYSLGDLASAREALDGFDPREVDGDLAAPLALVAGALHVRDDPHRALDLFDEARLLSPGTLIEEAALRRSVELAAHIHDMTRFASVSMQYVRRFLGSPYASQFAEAFVSGVIEMHETADLALVKRVIGAMEGERAQVIYLRIARKSAIEGYDRLLAFASDNAEAYAEGGEAGPDPRAVLYANVASVTSENVGSVLETLKGLDERQLSANDRQLLQAARAIAERVVSPPDTNASAPAIEEVAEATETEATEEATAADESEAFFAAARDKLKSVDALLGEDKE